MTQKPSALSRTCVVCREPCAKEELVRWVRDEEGEIVPDLLARSFGRGAWVHPWPGCLKKLIPGLSRSFKAPISTSAEDALQRLVVAAQHRVNQLIGSASRQKLLVFGGDATEEAYGKGQVALVVVARDAKAALKRGFVHEAISAGEAVSWGTKETWGTLLGRSEVAVLGVTDRGLARRLFGAIAMALLAPAPGDYAPTTSLENEISSEVE